MQGSLQEHTEKHTARIRDSVLSSDRVRVVGGGSKGALSGGGTLELAGVSGVLEYHPQEFTFTALAGTPLQEVSALLAENGQYLPFDPPFAGAGATLGGTVAAGLSGPGRYRYGGVRDFILGVTFVSGGGEVVTGGGKVVKNAAGFDFPKLMVGSLGRFGVMVALTFKVFPKPEQYATLTLDAASLKDATTLMQRLGASGFEPHALELEPPGRVLVRVGGTADALPARLERMQAFLARAGEVISGDAEERLWEGARAFSWVPAGRALVKVALSPAKLLEVERALTGLGEGLDAELPRRYSVGGNLLYLAWPERAETEAHNNPDTDALEALLRRASLPGLALTGTWRTPLLGAHPGRAFLRRVLGVFDPTGKFSVKGKERERAA